MRVQSLQALSLPGLLAKAVAGQTPAAARAVARRAARAAQRAGAVVVAVFAAAAGHGLLAGWLLLATGNRRRGKCGAPERGLMLHRRRWARISEGGRTRRYCVLRMLLLLRKTHHPIHLLLLLLLLPSLSPCPCPGGDREQGCEGLANIQLMLPQDLVDVALQRLRALVATRLVGVVRARVGHNLLEVRDKGTPGGVGPGVQLLLHHREAHGCLDDGVVVGRAALVHGVDEVALFVCGHHLLQDAVQEEEGVLSVL
eukprot:scaffold35935_cov15-Tisochrysis_lutea.AAC.1